MWQISFLLSALTLGIQLVPGNPQTGTVSGRIEIRTAPPRQVVSRYPSPGSPVQRSVGPIPTVVFIDGPVPGASPWLKPSKAAIFQKGLQFSPPLLVVPKGATVSFPNEDNELHNVFSYSKSKRFDLGRYPRGESKNVVFDKPGIVKIYCEVHPWMRAAVLVLENPYFAIVSGNGSFLIEGIPPGRYELLAWNFDAGSKRIPVDVPADKSPELLIQLSNASKPGTMERIIHLGALTVGAASPADSLSEGACCAAKP